MKLLQREANILVITTQNFEKSNNHRNGEGAKNSGGAVKAEQHAGKYR